MKKIIILGSTGSIGVQTLDILDIYKNYEVFALVAGKNHKLLALQIDKYKPKFAIMSDYDAYKKLLNIVVYSGTKILYGYNEVCNIVQCKVDCVVNGIMGIEGLKPTIVAIEYGNKVALANKESIICAGNLINNLLKKQNNGIIPLDSEHYAIQGILNQNVEKITLTASGGPFFLNPGLTRNLQNALKHPSWSMGDKITVNSATMFNKVLEVIEAHYLFNFSMNKIDILIHPQSIVHAFVHYKNGVQHASLFKPDMRIPLTSIFSSDKFTYSNKLNFVDFKNLSFYKPDKDYYPMLKFLESDQYITLTVANEIIVESFIAGKIEFDCIFKILEYIVGQYSYNDNDICSIEDINFVIEKVKAITIEYLKKF